MPLVGDGGQQLGQREDRQKSFGIGEGRGWGRRGPRGRGEDRNVDNHGQHIQSLSGIISGPSDIWYKTLS